MDRRIHEQSRFPLAEGTPASELERGDSGSVPPPIHATVLLRAYLSRESRALHVRESAPMVLIWERKIAQVTISETWSP